jgi:hypothetical protein
VNEPQINPAVIEGIGAEFERTREEIGRMAAGALASPEWKTFVASLGALTAQRGTEDR